MSANLAGHPLDDVDGVGVGQSDPHEGGGLARKSDLGVVVLGPQNDLADAFKADNGPILLPDDEALEFPDGAEIGIGNQVDLDEGPLVWPTAARKLLAARACRTCRGVMPKAAIRSGLSQTRMAKVRAPRMSAR